MRRSACRFHQLAPCGLRDGTACINDNLRFKNGSVGEVQCRDSAALALGRDERSTRHHTAAACLVQHLPHQPRHRVRIENDASAVLPEPLLVCHPRSMPPQRRGIRRVTVYFKKRSRKLRNTALLRPRPMVDKAVHARLSFLFQTFIDEFRQTSRTAHRFPGTDASDGGCAAQRILAFHQHDIRPAFRRRPRRRETGGASSNDRNIAIHPRGNARDGHRCNENANSGIHCQTNRMSTLNNHGDILYQPPRIIATWSTSCKNNFPRG